MSATPRYVAVAVHREGTLDGYDIIDTTRGERVTRLGGQCLFPDQGIAQREADRLNRAHDRARQP